jgi:tetratricopeptide (TPR) repeat protein
MDYSPGEFIPSSHLGGVEAMGAALVLGALTLLWIARRRAPVVAFGVAWLLIAFLPVSNVMVPTGILIAERTLFLPSIGFAIVVAGGADLVVNTARATPLVQRALATACALLILLGAVRSGIRQLDWRDTASVRLAMVRDSPRSWRAQAAQGASLFDAGLASRGIEAYEEALKWAPQPWSVRNELAQRLHGTGNDSAAVDQLRASLSEQPGQRAATAQLVVALLAMGQYAFASRIADSVIAADRSPALMVGLKKVADSALVLRAPSGSVRIRLKLP